MKSIDQQHLPHNPHALTERYAVLHQIRDVIDHLRQTDAEQFASDIAGLEAVREHLLALEGWHWQDDMMQTIQHIDRLPHSVRCWLLDEMRDFPT